VGTVPGFLAFCPNGAQGDSPGQRPVGSNVAIESRPEGAEFNGAEIHASTYPGRRFALPWAISFCPFGAEKQKNPHRAGTVPGCPSPVARSISRSNRPSATEKRQAFRHAIARGLPGFFSPGACSRCDLLCFLANLSLPDPLFSYTLVISSRRENRNTLTFRLGKMCGSACRHSGMPT
jgi:hypothetical protein